MYVRDAHEASLRPQEMTIRVTDGSQLLDLLWIRHQAIGNAEPSLPPADLPGEPVDSADPKRVGTWELLWKQSLDHLRRVQEAAPVSMRERSDLWSTPSISAAIDGLDLDVSQGVAVWRESLGAAPESETTVLDNVRRAWNAGLRVVVELPLTGEYFRNLSDATLLVSAATRRDSAEYAKALDAFATS